MELNVSVYWLYKSCELVEIFAFYTQIGLSLIEHAFLNETKEVEAQVSSLLCKNFLKTVQISVVFLRIFRLCISDNIEKCWQYLLHVIRFHFTQFSDCVFVSFGAFLLRRTVTKFDIEILWIAMSSQTIKVMNLDQIQRVCACA